MATNNFKTPFKQVFPVPITLPDRASLAVTVESLILAQMETIAGGTAPQGQPFTMGGMEITAVVMVPAGPCHFFHSNIDFESRDFQVAWAAPIASAAEFDGFGALDWWKTTKVYVDTGDTGYGAGNLTTAVAYCLLN